MKLTDAFEASMALGMYLDAFLVWIKIKRKPSVRVVDYSGLTP